MLVADSLFNMVFVSLVRSLKHVLLRNILAGHKTFFEGAGREPCN